MAHACTNCGRAFPDGSKEMLSGCPNCGGNKFRYHPNGVEGADAAPSDRAPPDPDDEGLPGREQGVVDRATTTVREWVGSRSTPDTADGTSGVETRPPASPDPGSPAGATPEAGDAGSETATTADTASDQSAGATTVDTTTNADPGSASATDSAPPAPGDSADAPEDTAQADARTGVADPAEIPDTPPDDGSPDLAPAEEHAAVAGTPDAQADSQTEDTEPADPTATPAASNLAQLREELNEQFESIKIVEPGEYELNLMGLYDREEYIISLMEDGRYAIEVPETWRNSEDLSDE
jgi:Zn-ribbon containing protein